MYFNSHEPEFYFDVLSGLEWELARHRPYNRMYELLVAVRFSCLLQLLCEVSDNVFLASLLLLS